MSSVRLIPLIFRGFVFLPSRITAKITPSIQPFRSFANYAPRSRKNSKSKKHHSNSTKHDQNQIIPDDLDGLPQPEKAYRRPQYHFNPKRGTSEYPNVILSNEEKEISVPFLKKVVETLEERGQQFLLPWGDDAAIESILSTLRELTTTSKFCLSHFI